MFWYEIGMFLVCISIYIYSISVCIYYYYYYYYLSVGIFSHVFTIFNILHTNIYHYILGIHFYLHMCVYGKNSVFIPIFRNVYIKHSVASFFYTHFHTKSIPAHTHCRTNIPKITSFNLFSLSICVN